MENKQLQKEQDIKTKLWWAIGIATAAILMTLLRIPFKFIVAIAAYFVMAIAVVKKDGAVGILQVIMVFPAIYIGIKNFLGGNDGADDTDTSRPAKLERLANFALFYTAVTILVTILFPIVRIIWNIFT